MSACTPRLPCRPVKLALVSGEYPELGNSLKRLGVTPIEILFDSRLPVPLGCHPDMQACLLGKETYVLRGSALQDKLSAQGISVFETSSQPGSQYPRDVLCNGFVWGKWLVGNPKTLDAAIQNAAQAQGLELLPVRQGYAACSVALLDEKACITADAGMAKALKAKGFTVLEIRPGFIKLPGYGTGFIGGCCGKISADVLAVSGSLESHPDGKAIRAFAKNRGVSICELAQHPLIDVGGILPLG